MFDKLSPDQLQKLNPEQAKVYIQAELVDAVRAATAPTSGTRVPRLYSPEQLQQARGVAINAVEDTVGDTADDELHQRGFKPGQQLTPEQAQALIDKTKTAISGLVSARGFSADYVNAVVAAYGARAREAKLPPYGRGVTDTLAFLARSAAQSVQAYPYAAAGENTQNVENVAAAYLNAALGATVKQAVEETRPKPAPKFEPPDDVSCSMAIMGWKETSDTFGRRVANDYVAIQVNLRNLNTKNEFLVHDIQVAIDTGFSYDDFGRFQAGRDKLLVRAVAQRGQSEDPRNLVLHTLEAAGAIAGAAAIATGVSAAKDAVVVFQGAFIPGFITVFPDHTVEQLNHISDLVFSASSTSKVLVPIQGSVPLVTFIGEKPLEQLPFAWCGHPPSGRMKQWMAQNAQQVCALNSGPKGGAKKEKGGGGNNSGNNPPAGNQTSETVVVTTEAESSADGSNSAKEPEAPSELRYKEWRAAALHILAHRTFVVVGGVHIQQVVMQPRLSSLDCPLLESRKVDISQTKDQMVTCTVSGSGLNLITAVDLETGGSTVPGKITAGGEGTSAPCNSSRTTCAIRRATTLCS